MSLASLAPQPCFAADGESHHVRTAPAASVRPLRGDCCCFAVRRSFRNKTLLPSWLGSRTIGFLRLSHCKGDGESVGYGLANPG